VDYFNAVFVAPAILEERRRAAERERMLRLAEAGRGHRPPRTAGIGRALIVVGRWLEGNAAPSMPPVVAPTLAGSDGGRRG
jgi:hypothetical protein